MLRDTTKQLFKGARVTLCHAVLSNFRTEKLSYKFVASGSLNESCKEKH